MNAYIERTIIEADTSNDHQNFWKEYKLLGQDPDDDSGQRSSRIGGGDDDADVDVDGEQEADWLEAAGFPQLTDCFRAGRELEDAALEPALRMLPRHQADTVRRRVQSLNEKLRQPGWQQSPGRQAVGGRQRHPGIRDVFRDMTTAPERDVDQFSAGICSRSVTPNSLDSAEEAATSASSAPGSPPTDGRPTPPPSLAQLFNGTPSGSSTSQNTPQAVRHPSSPSTLFPIQRMFRGKLFGGDIVASEGIEGIEMINYQHVGSMHLYRSRGRISQHDSQSPSPMSTSSPSSSEDLSDLELNLKQDLVSNASVTRSQSDLKKEAQEDNIRNRSGFQKPLSFEQVCRQQQQSTGCVEPLDMQDENNPPAGRTWMEFLGESDQQKLGSLLLLEVTAMFDKCGLRFSKRKPSKRKRREKGNVFGVSLSTLLERDQQILKESSKVPLVVRKLVGQLERRALTEEGILRIAAEHAKVHALTRKLEELFYTRPEEADRVLDSATPHELAALLKKWLRELPQPLVTLELVSLFYRTHELPDHLCSKALNLLVLLLPPENRNTLRVLMEFLNRVVDNQQENKMSLYNVAMIAAPSLLPASYVEGVSNHSTNKSSLNSQVQLAAICCKISETLIRTGDFLWVVPQTLINQVRKQNERERLRSSKRDSPIKRLLGFGKAQRPAAESRVEELPVGVLRVSAPQFAVTDFPLSVTEDMTAGSVVLCLIEATSRDPDGDLVVSTPGRRNGKRRPHSVHRNRSSSANRISNIRGRNNCLELARNANISCLLSTADTELALRTHYLYEVGGNIGGRQLEQTALISAVKQVNPGASLALRCHHRNGNNPRKNPAQ